MNSDIEIYVIGVRQWTRKSDNHVFFVIDYVRPTNWTPKTDFINAIEYTGISKKIGDKHWLKCTGHRQANDFDKLYVYDVDIK